jgi:hypothetical protein
MCVSIYAMFIILRQRFNNIYCHKGVANGAGPFHLGPPSLSVFKSRMGRDGPI